MYGKPNIENLFNKMIDKYRWNLYIKSFSYL